MFTVSNESDKPSVNRMAFFTYVINVLKKYISIDINLKEKYYASMGLNIIWIDNFDEIPKILSSFLS